MANPLPKIKHWKAKGVRGSITVTGLDETGVETKITQIEEITPDHYGVIARKYDGRGNYRLV